MLETALVAFATFFATIGPVDVAVVFASLTGGRDAAELRRLAARATGIAAIVLAAFTLFGQTIFAYLGVSLAALRIGGGILLLLIGIDLVFGRDSGGITATASERAEASASDDIAVFPLAIPLIAGPGAIGAGILLYSAAGDWRRQAVVLLALAAVLLITYVLLRAAPRILRVFGKTGMHVITRVMGVALTALAVQFMIDGAREIGLLPAAAAAI